MTPFPSSPAPTLQAMASPFDPPACEAPNERRDLDLRENPFAPKRVDDILDDVDAKTWLRGWVHVPVDVIERLGHEIVLHRVAERLELQDPTRRRAEADPEARRPPRTRRPPARRRPTPGGTAPVGNPS